MLWGLVIVAIFKIVCVIGSFVVEPGPSYPPTKGEVWPKPQIKSKESKYYTFNPSNFHVNVTDQTCTILTRAIERYIYVFSHQNGIIERFRPKNHLVKGTLQNENYQGNAVELQVQLTNPCEKYPYFGMDESYNLTVSTSSNLKSASIWGIIRGLETFAQLMYLSNDFSELRLNKTQIIDYPRYPHRGVLVDTSRHFISLNTIKTILDAMAMNKMNVFHWHIVDDQSFPYQSEKFPNLSEEGAYHPSMVYSKSDIQMIINYARDRGIRVLPEFDVPGHTRSWGVAYPNILTECYQDGKVFGLGPMNPIKNVTYKLLKDLFEELQDLFPDKYFHVGGDEVELSCWRSNPELQEYMRENNMHDASELHSLFMQNVVPLLSNRSTPIVWQEVFTENVPLTKDTLVQVWKSDSPIYSMIQVLTAGHRVLSSSYWYLDHLNRNFRDYFTVDPRQIVYDNTHNITLAENIVGGEACMWAEMVDDRNILSRMWPRASAVAERLWSPGLNTQPRLWQYRNSELTQALKRIEEHTCRMIRRGIPAQPANGPGFCIA